VETYYLATRTFHWWSEEGICTFVEGTEYNLFNLLQRCPSLMDKVNDGTLSLVPEVPNRLARILTLDLV
jgi:hypothetical protein